MDRERIMEGLEEIQDRVYEMNFQGSNEHDLWLREEIADYIETLLIKKEMFFRMKAAGMTLKKSSWLERARKRAKNRK